MIVLNFLRKYWYYIPIVLLAIIGTAVFLMSGGQVKVVFDLMNKLLAKKDETAARIDAAQISHTQAKADIKAKEEADLAKIEADTKKKLDDAKKNDTTDELADNLWNRK